MGFFHKKKQNTDIVLSDGIVMKQPLQMETSSWLRNCMVKSLLVFSVVFGSIGCFLSSFEMDYYIILTAGILFAMALLFTTIYYRGWIMDVVYIVFLFIFFFAVQAFWTYINSGYYLLINRVLSTVEDYFELPGMQYYEIAAKNEVLAVSVVVIFIGTVMMIVANVIISRTMNVWFLLIMTGLLWILPMYFRLEADAFYVILMLTGYIAVWSIRSSGAYGMDRKHRDYKWKDKRGKQLRIWYVQDAATMLEGMGIFAVAVLLLYGLASMIGQKDTFSIRYRQNPYKEESEVLAQELTSKGFSIFNRYEAVGGVAKGQLGGVGSVRPDYQTDLIVTFAPYSYEPVYLKAYTGIDYVSGDFTWRTNELPLMDNDLIIEDTPYGDVKSPGSDYEAGLCKASERGARGSMWIQNTGADVDSPYAPYHTPALDMAALASSVMKTTEDEDDSDLGVMYTDLSIITGGIAQNETMSYTFYPPVNEAELRRKAETLSEEEEQERLAHLQQAEEWYLNVPEECYAAVAEASQAAGIRPGDTQEEIVQKVKDYFEAEFQYTTRPGRSPRSEDFVTHFLREKKGYCTYFATAAAMLYRYNGIPTRYIEGYVITYEDIMMSDLNEELDYKDFYQGFSPLGETGVVEVEVTDARAHAWVEVFDPYLGWMPEEVTTAAVAPDEDLESFWDIFGDDPSGNEEGELGDGFNLGNMDWNLDDIRGIWIGLLAVLCLLGLFTAGRKGYRNWKLYQSWHTESMNENVLAYYHIISERLRGKDSAYAQCPTYQRQLQYIAVHCEEWNWDAGYMAKLLERACYSRNGISDFDCRRLMIELTDIEKKVKKWKH